MPNTRIYWLHTLSPTHAGIGRGLGYIDLPIDRDGVTGWPILRGSAFKGVWADHYAQQLLDPGSRGRNERNLDTPNSRLLKAAFGIAGEDDTSSAGALIPTDAELVCLPVRSFRGTFAWATSPLCLQMLRRTLELAGVKEVPDAPSGLADADAHHYEKGETKTVLKQDGRIYLEDLDFTAKVCSKTTSWADKLAAWVFPQDDAWQEQFKKRFVVLPDNAFDFLCETGTEVHTRVKIDDATKTVADKALWTEESLPAETILAGVVQCERVFQKNGTNDQSVKPETLIQTFATTALSLQIGGKATVGRGQVRCVFTPVEGGGR
jgi:CRISPR-associated protein Cmr4